MRYLLLLAMVTAAMVTTRAQAQLGQRLKQRFAPQTVGEVYGFYEGDMHFGKSADLRCTALSHGAYKVYFATHKNAAGVEALMGGEQVLHAYINGTDINHLQVKYLGDAGPTRTMKLKSFGTSFLGSMQSKTLVSELYGGCTPTDAEFKVSLTGQDGAAAFQAYAEQFKWDESSEQDLGLALKGQINEALPRLQQAFAQKATLFSATNPQMLRYFYYLGQAYDEAGQWPYAAYWYDKAVTVCLQSFGVDNACQPLALGKLGVSLAANGKFSEGEAAVRRALAVADRITGGNHPSTWVAHNALARIMIASGQYAEAVPVVDQAMALAQRTTSNTDLNVSIVKVTYAQLERQTGQLLQSEQNLQQAITLAQTAQGPESVASVTPRIGLAILMNALGKDSDAEPIAKKALDEAVKNLGPERPDHPSLSTARITLANIYTAEGKFRDAEPLYRQASENNKKFLGPDHPSVGSAELDWAKMLRLSGREKEALPLLQDAYRISRLSAAQGLRWHVPAQLMEEYSAGKTANPVLAIFYGKEAINQLQGVRGNLAQSGGVAQQGFVSSDEVKSVYLHLAHLLLADHRVSEAQQVLAMVSEEEMNQFLGQSVLVNNTDAPAAGSTATPTASAAPHSNPAPTLPKKPKPAADQAPTEVALSQSEAQLAALAAEQVNYGQEYADLINRQQEQGADFSPADKARLKTVTAKVDDLSAKFLAAQTKVTQQSKDPQARKARNEEITGFTTAFEGTVSKMGHGAVVLEYFMMPDEVDIILTTPTSSVPVVSKIDKKQLNKQIKDFRVALSDNNRNPLPMAQALYKALIQPVAPALEAAHAKTLMLVLHDTLRYVPFAALHDGKDYLIESMAVVNVNQASRDKLVSKAQSDWQMWGLGVTKQGADYPALPYAGEELNDIKIALGGKSQVKLDQEFTESGLRGGLGGNYQVIHIASHFEFTPGSVDRSVLLLGDGHRMSLSEIGLKLNFNGVELLTLSACETAVGDDTMAEDGSEVEGLANVAQNKGAMAVIATLWPVADESTATLMNALYQAHKNDHMDKADALRTAQLTLLHGATPDPGSVGGEHRGLSRREGSSPDSGAPTANTTYAGSRYAHPFYWAPFILMGNWL